MVAQAPALASDASFELMLASSLGPAARGMDRRGWVGGVWRSTAVPFCLVLVLAAATGGWTSWHCEGAIRLRDALGCHER